MGVAGEGTAVIPADCERRQCHDPRNAGRNPTIPDEAQVSEESLGPGRAPWTWDQEAAALMVANAGQRCWKLQNLHSPDGRGRKSSRSQARSIADQTATVRCRCPRTDCSVGVATTSTGSRKYRSFTWL